MMSRIPAPITSNEVLAAFPRGFSLHKLAFKPSARPFQPLTRPSNRWCRKSYPNDPFADFIRNSASWIPCRQNTAQVRFLAYYYDFFDDIIKAYKEFCRQGVELLCACVPPGGPVSAPLEVGLLFPRFRNQTRYLSATVPGFTGWGCEEAAPRNSSNYSSVSWR